MNFLFRLSTLTFCRFAIVFVMLLVCTGNITNSVLLKYGFRDDHPIEGYQQSLTLVSMMERTAPRPFVYRSTGVALLRQFVGELRPEWRDKLYRSITRYDSLRHSYFSGVPDSLWTPVVALTYHLTYLVVVVATMLALLCVYRLARLHGYTFGESLGVLAGFSFLYPLTFQQGAYYYDFIELAAVFAACYFTLRRAMFRATLVIALASFNKETFFIVPFALTVLHAPEVSIPARLRWFLLQTFCTTVGRHFIMDGYAGNTGDWVETHLADNLKFWLNPTSYLRFYNLIAKGIFTPSLQNPLMLLPLLVFFYACWLASGPRYRRYLYVSMMPLILLFALFGYKDEARNFSLAFPALLLVALSGARHFNLIFAPTLPAKGGASCPPDQHKRPGGHDRQKGRLTHASRVRFARLPSIAQTLGTRQGCHQHRSCQRHGDTQKS